MKIYKAGTKITMHSGCNFVGTDQKEDHILGDDMTEKELEKMVYEWSVEVLGVEAWFEVKDDESTT